MGFEVLTAVKMSMSVFWVVKPCGLVCGYQPFGDGYSMFVRNVGTYLPTNPRVITAQKTNIDNVQHNSLFQ
jgi:hypothetical protein